MKKRTQQGEPNPNMPSNMPMGRRNYLFIGLGLVAIGLGLILLSGGGSDDPRVFSYEIFNFRRLFVAPLLMLGGLVFEIYALMYRPKK